MMLRKLNLKVTFCLFLLVFPLTLSGIDIQAEQDGAANTRAPNVIRLATWNIKWLGGGYFKWQLRNDSELEQVASIISGYDLIAITEVMPNTAQFKKVIGKLSDMGHEYSYLISKPIGFTKRYLERYAIVYRKGLIKPIEIGGLYPDPYEDLENGIKGFIRDPYWATFRAGNFDFTVVVSHIHWGEVTDREREHKLLGAVFDYVQKENGKSESDVILVGDFNVNPEDPKMFLNLDSDDGNPDDYERKKVHPPIVPLFLGRNVKTLIEDKSLYDNIFFQTIHVREYTGESGVYYFDKVLFPDADRETRINKAERISDHRPVWADFRIDLDDDDGNDEDVED